MTALIVVGSVAAWLFLGRQGVKLTQYSMTAATDNSVWFFVLFGPFIIPAGLLQAFDGGPNGGGLLMTRTDRKNPFRTELSEAIRLYRLLQYVPGEDAETERNHLAETIGELRGWPERLKQHDGDRLIAVMKSELETSRELSRERLAAYEEIEQELTDEAKALSP